MIIRCTIVLFMFFFSFGFSQERNYSFSWDTYAKPVIDSLYGQKKVVISDYFILSKEQNGEEFYELLSNKYDMNVESWSNHWDIWRINYSPPYEWRRRMSTKKRNRLLNSRRWSKKKIEVIDVSSLIFLERDLYLIAIKTYCPGLCSNTNLYMIRLNRENSTFIIEHTFESISAT